MNGVILNIINLSFVKLIRLFLPLISIPILASKLSSEYLAYYFLAMLISAWISIVVDYGYDYSGVRKISGKKIESKFLKKTFLGVFFSKLLVSISIFSFSLLSILFLDSEKYIFVIIGVLLGISQSLIPVWFYLAMERLNKISFFTILMNIYILIYAFFISTNEQLYYLLLSLVLIRFLSSAILSKNYIGISDFFYLKNYYRAIRFLIWGKRMATFQVVTSLYTTFPGYYFSLIGSHDGIIAYGIADRVTKACGSAVSPVSQALYPYFCKIRGTSSTDFNKMKKKFSYIQIFLSILIISITMVFSQDIINYIGGTQSIDNTQWLLSLLLISILLTNVSNIYGVQGLLVQNYDRIFNKVIYMSAIFSLPILFVFTNSYQEFGVVFTILLTEFIVMVAMIYFYRIYCHD